MSDNRGRRTPAFERIKANLRARRAPCWLCGQPIDYTLPWDDLEAFTVDHIKPRSTHPEMADEPSNCLAAHAKCNKSRGNSAVTGLGTTSRDW
jgi:5-methylcytosine-specific restriction endonuclease McrA